MTLTNYWWLLIWIFIGGVLVLFIPKQQELVNGRKVERWTMPAALILIAPYIVWAGFRSNAFGDTGSYQKAFRECASSLGEIGNYLSSVTKDKGFYLLMALEKSIFGDSCRLFFVLLAAFQLLSIVWMFRKYSEDYWFSIFLFIASTDYISWTFNGIRQFTAVVIAYAATPFILKKKYIPSILLFIIKSSVKRL